MFGDGEKVKFTQSEAEDLGWVEDASVDVITCSVAMHCEFRPITRILRSQPNGVLI